MKTTLTRALALCLLCTPGGLPINAAVAAEAGHDTHENKASHDAEGILEMDPAERQAQGIKTMRATPRELGGSVRAPGEVRMNAYASAQLTPRIRAQVVTRHVRLGDTVNKDQPLVTLSSVPMAQAQGELIEADRAWNRVRQLGREVVSDKRYIAAQVARQRAWATVRAYGMAPAQIRDLLKTDDATHATGTFDLLSPRAGRVVRDDFVIGEVIEPGRVLFEVSDESRLWVEARLPARDAARVSVGAKARVTRDGVNWLDGEVVQLHHRLDETTRTQGVRIEVANQADILHAGEYVDARLTTDAARVRLAVPNDAVLLMQGAPAVFKVDGNRLHPRPVLTGMSEDGFTEIKAGLAAGDVVVSQGAFLLKSLSLKSQMGEGHGH